MKSSFTECIYSTRQNSYERHFHNIYELIYVCGGEAVFNFGKKRYTAKPDDMLFIGKLEEHSVEIKGDSYLRYYTKISPEQLNRLVSDPLLKSVFFNRPNDFNHVFDMSDAKDEMRRIWEKLVREHNSPGDAGDMYTNALFTEMLVMCYRLNKPQFPLPGKYIHEAVVEAQAYIDINYAEPISIEKLAGMSFLSVSYFSHAFLSWTGYSPKQYIMLSRMSAAKEMLTHSALPVKNIAARCGFTDVNNFIRLFKKQMGITPHAYRGAK